jgi:hypothetical protein
MRALSDALGLLAEYQAATPRERNYRSCIWAGRLSEALGSVAAEVCGPDGGVVAAAHSAGADCFARDLACLMRSLRDAGQADSEIVRAVQAVIIARMEVGLPQHTWFA